jgi:hypothetical protein
MSSDWKPGWLKVEYRPTENGSHVVVRAYPAGGVFTCLTLADSETRIKERVRSEDDEF